jgi:hypothetical protein
LSPPETPWRPFRGLSRAEQNSMVAGGYDLVCTECNQNITKGERIMRSARLPGERVNRSGLPAPILHVNRVENWKHVQCPQGGA